MESFRDQTTREPALKHLAGSHQLGLGKLSVSSLDRQFVTEIDRIYERRSAPTLFLAIWWVYEDARTPMLFRRCGVDCCYDEHYEGQPPPDYLIDDRVT